MCRNCFFIIKILLVCQYSLELHEIKRISNLNFQHLALKLESLLENCQIAQLQSSQLSRHKTQDTRRRKIRRNLIKKRKEKGRFKEISVLFPLFSVPKKMKESVTIFLLLVTFAHSLSEYLCLSFILETKKKKMGK